MWIMEHLFIYLYIFLPSSQVFLRIKMFKIGFFKKHQTEKLWSDYEFIYTSGFEIKHWD